jgi:hypothetical protein
MKNVMKPSYTVISGTVLGFMFLITLLAYWYQARLFPTQVMSNDIATLASIFEKINETCGIVDFQGDRLNIDFLNVISFEGSEVGPMNLKFPKHWQGPYLKTNLTFQEKYYQIVKTKNGYFIVPGNGVKLLNGKTIGKDIILTKDTSIADLIKNKALVDPSGRPLALPIKTLMVSPSEIFGDLFMYAANKALVSGVNT